MHRLRGVAIRSVRGALRRPESTPLPMRRMLSSHVTDVLRGKDVEYPCWPAVTPAPRRTEMSSGKPHACRRNGLFIRTTLPAWTTLLIPNSTKVLA